VVPPDGFTLQSEDQVQIRISGIGVLENPVVEV
jgi:fumarylacetoacetate (FAA) hydrolase family protein